MTTPPDDSNLPPVDSDILPQTTDDDATMARLAAALFMASRNFRVFLAKPNGRAPLFNNWQSLATTDEAQIRQWWSDHPDANIGIATGGGIVVIDLDEKNGKRGIEMLCSRLGIERWELESETFVVRTPSNGLHLYYLSPEPYANAVNLLNGVDVRSDGGLVIGPGSTIDGKPYKIVSDAPLTSIRDDLIPILGKPRIRVAQREPAAGWDIPAAIDQAIGYLRKREPAIEGQGGNAHSYVTAVELKDLGISQDKCLELLFAPIHDDGRSWNETCIPEWDSNELAVTVANAYHYGKDAPGSKNAHHITLLNDADDPATGIPDDLPDTAPSGMSAPARATLAQRFSPMSEAEQDAIPDPVWLINSVIQVHTINFFVGPSQSYKTFLVMDLCLSAASGLAWCDSGKGEAHSMRYRAKRPLTTVYIPGEGAAGVAKLRRIAWRKKRGIDESIPFYVTREMPRFADADHIQALADSIDAAGIKPDILVIDTLARAMAGLDENSAKDTGVIFEHLDYLKRRFGCAVIVIHHSGKTPGKGARGSSNIDASADAVFESEGDKQTRTATIWNKKQKDAEAWREPLYFRGDPVSIGRATEPGMMNQSLVFYRITAQAAPAALQNLDRLQEVEAALLACAGAGCIGTNTLAEAIVNTRLLNEPEKEAKVRANTEMWHKLVENEARTLRRQTRHTEKGKQVPGGLLSRFLMSEPDAKDLIWTLPPENSDK
ncbi:MAG: AAA family ATPase [Alphaproteobacteria bacterium]|nr:AAA family ATPase [Alphaproteobacteria bacterium]